jgi:hypothetical protein
VTSIGALNLVPNPTNVTTEVGNSTTGGTLAFLGSGLGWGTNFPQWLPFAGEIGIQWRFALARGGSA